MRDYARLGWRTSLRRGSLGLTAAVDEVAGSMIVDEEADYAGTNSTTRPRNDHVGPVGSAAPSSPATT